jgi:hypothetical protein
MGMLSDVGGMAGGIIGGMFGGPMGAQIGQQIGSLVGQKLEGLLSQFGMGNTQAGLSNSVNNEASNMAHEQVGNSGLPKFITDQLHQFIDTQQANGQQTTPADCQNKSNQIFAMFNPASQ